ncbi:lysozyme family protein [Niallia sp. NCCP-28]|uniref:lysozyme family protein n=1 Tax=Niallia sp. NCCP-28 TaxID=2934712 RepID=UPI00208657FB|nr:lysozyme family protein [Niallia sp. NCCP-28]GKU84390.1 putative membrane protein YocA [Niallia sp. NCCP-28]
MKKKRKAAVNVLFIIVIVLYSIYLLTENALKQSNEKRLMKYLPIISSELEENDLSADEFAPVLLAIMDQESHGKGNDPMQSSESAGLKRNKIDNPYKSIKQGVFHFSEMYRYGEKLGVDLETIIQSYNMGPGYIDFIASNKSAHSENSAKTYSEYMVEKSPSIYTCNNDKLNFRYPYCYGDYTYAKKVTAKLDAMNSIIKNNL